MFWQGRTLTDFTLYDNAGHNDDNGNDSNGCNNNVNISDLDGSCR